MNLRNREYHLVATNHLDGGIYATPAVVGRAIYVRTENALYRIEKPADAVSAAPSATGRDGSTPSSRNPGQNLEPLLLAVDSQLVEVMRHLCLVGQQPVDRRLVPHRLVDRLRHRLTVGAEEHLRVVGNLRD